VYVCDPVLGDDGVFYVPRELVTVYKEEVISLATILTPNQFECEVLSDVAITDSASAVAAMDALHAKGVRCVVITSSNLPAGQSEVMTLFASVPWDEVCDEETRWPAGARAGGSHARFSMEIPRLPIHFTGTGDLTAALLLAWSHRLPRRFASVVEHAIASVQGVCSVTLRRAGDSTASRELRVVESKGFLEAPAISLSVAPI